MNKTLKIIPLDKIFDPEKPLRSDLSPESVADLVDSIKKVGIIEPLIVAAQDNGFEVIAGHRRLLAAEIAGLVEAPCLIVEAKGMDREILKLHENLARAEINPIDWAIHLDYLKKQSGMSNAKIAAALGVSETFVQQHLDVLAYPETLLEALKGHAISFAAARELNSIKDPKKKEVYVRHAIVGGVSPAMAVNWRKEANREPVQLNEEPQQTQTTPEVPTNSEPLPECPVCGKGIPFEEQMTLTIHASCQPQDAGAADGA